MSLGVQCDQCKSFFKVTQAELRPPLNWVIIEIGTTTPAHFCTKRCAMAYLASS